ncbi:MAG TPA: DUF4292 domain-containing protein [Chitinophagaceae bacterium]
MIRIVLIGIITASLFASCRSTRKIQTAVAPKDTTVAVAPVVKDNREDSVKFIREAYGNVQKNAIDFTTFSAKIDVDYVGVDGKKYNVNANLRMYKDSVIWVSITAIFGIEGLRAYITPDSVKLLDKQNKIYTARSVSYLQEVTALPLDMPSLQQLLIGNPVFFDSTNIVSYTQTEQSISMLSVGDFFKNLFTIDKNSKYVQSSKLDDLDELRNRTCYLYYSAYEDKKGPHFPTKRRITVTEKGNLDIKLDFKQYAFNETLSFPFSVPKNYKPN